jgi:hypothetical protein
MPENKLKPGDEVIIRARVVGDGFALYSTDRFVAVDFYPPEYNAKPVLLREDLCEKVEPEPAPVATCSGPGEWDEALRFRRRCGEPSPCPVHDKQVGADAELKEMSDE